MMQKFETGLEHIIFWSRWLQAPIYLGLIVAQILYCYKFAKEVILLVTITGSSTELGFLLAVLTLIDIAMVANLITMVVIGGYATFVSKLNIDDDVDRPDWLSHIDPGAIKIKLASSLVGISSIHLLRSFIMVGNPNALQDMAHTTAQVTTVSPIDPNNILWQVVIHMTFVVSTLLLAITEYIMHRRYPKEVAPLQMPPDRNS